jgi:parallel beta-helix repeat protein
MKTINLFMALVLVAGLALVVGPVPVAYAATLTVDASTGTVDFGDACPDPTNSAVYKSLQAAIDCAVSGDTIVVNDGTYGVTGQNSGCEYGFPTAIKIRELDNLTIQAAPGHEPVVKPVTTVEADIVSISVEDSDHLIIDNIDSDQTIAQFDNWHVCGSDDLTVRNSTFEGGEDGIDFNTDLTTALIENNSFININTGSGDEVLDFTDGSYSDIVIQDNVFEKNYRHITINPPSGDTASGFIIRRNFMDGTTSQEGVRFNDGGGPVSDITLENNVIMNSKQQGLYVKPPVSNITVQHNTFFNNTEEEIRLREAAGDVLIKNNIIYANGTHAAISARAPFPPGPLPGEDFNLVFNDGPGTESGSASPITVFGANTITGSDPLFVSTAAGSEDLHLMPGSPAIAAGTDLGVTDDIEKGSRPNPAGTLPDMGAYEFEQKPTAIALVSFSAQAGADSVALAWETGTEVDNAGFNLHRAMTQDGPWTQINEALIAAQGDPVSGASYSFLDTPDYGTYYYRLEDVDYNGVSTIHGPVRVTVARPLRRPLYRPSLPEF